MSKLFKIFTVAMFSFLMLMSGFGYASVTGSLSIVGTAEALPPEKLFITAVTTSSTKGGATVSDLYSFSPTNVNSTVTLPNKNASATVTVTVWNNTAGRYEFNAAKYTEELYSNPNITVALTNLTTGKPLLHGDKVEPGERLSFTVEYKYKDGYTPSGTETLNSFINYEFLPPSELPPVYIREVEVISGNGSYTGSSLGTSVLNVTFNVSSSDVVVYKITMNNRSNDDYGYHATVANLKEADNAKISYILLKDYEQTTKLQRRDLLPKASLNSHGSITFYLVAAANKNNTNASELNGIFDIRFSTPISDIPAPDEESDDGQIAVENALEKFTTILNTPEEFADLKSLMDNAPSGRNDTYIAYVPGAPKSDKDASLALFDGQLQISIDGELQTVHFLIKKEDVTGDGKVDYTIYMTTNDLSTPSKISSSGWFNQTYNPSLAVVYATTYTEIHGEWIRLGDIYKGDGRICDYDGGMQSFRPSWTSPSQSVPTGSGSLHTDTWVTTEAYYGVPAGSSLSDVLTAKANDLKVLKQLIDEAEAITSSADYIFLYTKASRDVLNTALEEAKTLYANNSYTGNQTSQNANTQAEIVTYSLELRKAIDGLVDAF